jgi:4-methoxybenzoate monooxygenase (O-demethylating)
MLDHQRRDKVGMIEGHMAIEPPKGVPVWDTDPYDPAILVDPDAYYAELRAKGPFAYIPKYSILACGRFDETQEVFSDWARFVSSRGVGLQDFHLETPWRPQSLVVEADPPDHTKTRKVLMRAMSPKATGVLKEKFRLAAEKLVDALLEQGPFEAVGDLAEAYPISVFPAAVGLRHADKRRLIDYGAMVFNGLGPDNELRRTAMARGPDIVPWIAEQCRRDNLEPGGFAETIFEAADEGEISEEEAEMLVRSLLSAGVDTTVTGIGNALWCLAQFPDQFEKLKQDPGLVRPAFEEVLRFTSPVHSFCRTANVDTKVSGIDIVKGTKILCVLGAANGDAEKWPNAQNFDVERRPMGHLAMGVGIHTCVGQNLARAEVGAVLSAIVSKVDSIEMTGKAKWRPNNAIHALDKLPIVMTRN